MKFWILYLTLMRTRRNGVLRIAVLRMAVLRMAVLRMAVLRMAVLRIASCLEKIDIDIPPTETRLLCFFCHVQLK
jgi:hypothetical protein